MITNHWIYKGKEFTDATGYFGFVYLITNKQTQRKYIGKKQFFFSRKKKRAGKRSIRIFIDSDWREYYGSSEKLLDDVKTLGTNEFSREILSLHHNKRDLTYTELQEQFNRNVLEDENYYNDSIGGKFFRYMDGVLENKKVNVFDINGSQYFCHSEKRRKQMSERYKLDNPNYKPGAKDRQRTWMIKRIDEGNPIRESSYTMDDETKDKIRNSRLGMSNPRKLIFDGEEVLTITKYMKKYRVGFYSVIESIEHGIIILATKEQEDEYSCGKQLSDEHKEKLRKVLDRVRPKKGEGDSFPPSL